MSKDDPDSGWNEPEMGAIEGHELTFSSGYGSHEGETLIADGHDFDMSLNHTGDSADFFRSENHDHYGSGGGNHDNGASRGAYTGPGH